jgi:hypothetical protein
MLSAITDLGSVGEIEAEYQGRGLTLGFNARYLIKFSMSR